MSIAALASRDGNEAAATLKVLQSLDFKGCVVTSDALHRHPKMAEGVRAAGAHCALKLKANNGPLFACALQAFAQADASGALAFHETNEQGHDRFERRRASIVASPKRRAAFPGLVAFGRIESERRAAKGETKTVTHYVALSKTHAAQNNDEATTHWAFTNTA